LWWLEKDEKLGVAEGRLGVADGGWDLTIVGRSMQVSGSYVDDGGNDVARKKPTMNKTICGTKILILWV
jgi:hypothetical protein